MLFSVKEKPKLRKLHSARCLSNKQKIHLATCWSSQNQNKMEMQGIKSCASHMQIKHYTIWATYPFEGMTKITNYWCCNFDFFETIVIKKSRLNMFKTSKGLFVYGNSFLYHSYI